MKRRMPLRNNLEWAWNQCQEDYNARLINSERTLQAALWANLRARLKDDPVRRHQRVFIEPAITLNDDQIIYPDLVICNSRTIIGVVEIKFLPRTKPRFSKDLKTLASLAAQQLEVPLKIDRFRGSKPGKHHYRFAEHVLLAWAGIHGCSEEIDECRFAERNSSDFKGYYFELHGLTCSDKPLQIEIISP